MIAEANEHTIERAVTLLRSGRLVAIPTETVYGLAGDASNPGAVGRIFTTKGRPADHPLIVHLAAPEMIDEWAIDVPESARRLAEAFWPGPLTMILARHPSVLPAVTGGLDTVALRVPAHPVTLSLLKSFKGGLAAPSANRFGRVSPTTAQDVQSEFGDSIDLIVDGGPCEIGLESTIVAWVDGRASIVRPGAIDSSAISNAIGDEVQSASDGSVRAPGTLAAHYAPSTPLELASPALIATRAEQLLATGARVGVLSLDAVAIPGLAANWNCGGDLGAFASSLYSRLRQADDEALDVLLVSIPPEHGIGTAIADRLRRAAQGPPASGSDLVA